MNTINNYNLNYNTYTRFAGGNSAKSAIPKTIIDKLQIDMKTRRGFKNDFDFVPAPDSVPTRLKEMFRKMRINWETHVEPSQKKSMY